MLFIVPAEDAVLTVVEAADVGKSVEVSLLGGFLVALSHVPVRNDLL